MSETDLDALPILAAWLHEPCFIVPKTGENLTKEKALQERYGALVVLRNPDRQCLQKE